MTGSGFQTNDSWSPDRNLKVPEYSMKHLQPKRPVQVRDSGDCDSGDSTSLVCTYVTRTPFLIQRQHGCPHGRRTHDVQHPASSLFTTAGAPNSLK